jgi:cyclophilin family peptidyl-prolyl cis-trans isomerase
LILNRVHGGIRFVKLPLLMLLASVSMAHATLVAHVATDRGTIDVELQHAKAPQAVANFITLAQGTRGRIHPATGAVINNPLYIGEKFFRVINDTSFKIAQTGSGTGTNNGGPGFTFKDEFDPALTHVPYVLSMANSGPNTNGSQIFFTGNATIPSLNNVHTVFGLVTDVPSRAVIDAIHAAGNNATTITGITFDRTDPAAVAFNEHAQSLPTVKRPGGFLTVTRNVASTWNLNPLISTGAIFRAFSSTGLNGGWSELTAARQHVGIGKALLTPVLFSAPLDTAAPARTFYHLSVADHPGSVAPSNLISRTASIGIGADSIAYAFNSSGIGGTATYTPAIGSPSVFPFTTFSNASGGHDYSFVADNGTTGPLARYFLIKIGCDSATNTTVSGRHSISVWNGFSWQPAGSGAATITR